MLTKQIREFCESLGLDTMGIIPIRTFEELRPLYTKRQDEHLQNEFEEKDIEKRIHPEHYMEDAKSILSIAFPYYHEGTAAKNGLSIYTKRADYHKVVRFYLDQICEYIHSLGGKAEGFVDSNTLPERYIAYLAGVGFIGRNNMIITEKYGSYVFLGEIITDLHLEGKEVHSFDEIKEYKNCNDCRLCYQECPTKSIHTGKIKPNICLSYLTQKKELTDQEIRLLKDNVFGCDYCQLKCPYNQEVMRNVLKEFETMSAMNDEVEVYAGMDNRYFKNTISKTSCGWRGKNIIKRNAILNLARNEKSIREYEGDSPYINEYIRRAEQIYQKDEQKPEQ